MSQASRGSCDPRPHLKHLSPAARPSLFLSRRGTPSALLFVADTSREIRRASRGVPALPAGAPPGCDVCVFLGNSFPQSVTSAGLPAPLLLSCAVNGDGSVPDVTKWLATSRPCGRGRRVAEHCEGDAGGAGRAGGDWRACKRLQGGGAGDDAAHTGTWAAASRLMLTEGKCHN